MISTTLDIKKIKADFPVLQSQSNGQDLVYLDNAATTQKPNVVIDRLKQFYTHEYGTIHRGVYFLSQQATEFYDNSRRTVQKFINAEHEKEIVFTRGTTESINLVAHGLAQDFLKAGDEILITAMEHHANIVPWQEACKRSGAVLKVAPINTKGEIIQHEFDALLTEKTKVVAFVHVSNALGTINPAKELIAKAKAVGAITLLDGAQSVAHMPVDVQNLECDFFVFSGHKLYGPTGIGILYGKYEVLDSLPPYQTGGDMIETVTFEKTTFARAPQKFEAGTPAIAEPLGLAAAIDYLSDIGMDVIDHYENELKVIATEKLESIPGVKIIGTAAHKAAVISFIIDGVHPHDVGTILDEKGLAIRAGHHCAQPIMDFFKVPATNRASFSFYNTTEDIEKLVDAVKYCQEIML